MGSDFQSLVLGTIALRCRINDKGQTPPEFDNAPITIETLFTMPLSKPSIKPLTNELLVA